MGRSEQSIDPEMALKRLRKNLFMEHAPAMLQGLIEQDGGTYVSSVGEHFALDNGHGLFTTGVNMCVALATEAALSHMSPDLNDQSIQEVCQWFLQNRQPVDVFGSPNSRFLQNIVNFFQSAGIPLTVHTLSSDENDWFVYVKNKRVGFREITIK